MTSNVASFACGPYAVDNALVESTCVFTNNPPCGAMRGFGAVQACFAHEAQMDKLAVGARDRPDRAQAPQLARTRRRDSHRAAHHRLVAGCRSHPPRRGAAGPEPEELPSDPIRIPGGSGNTTRGEGVKRGVGFAVGFRSVCFAEGFDDYTAARVKLHSDGSAEVHCAAVEVGQGLADVIFQVARTELGTDDIVLAPGTTTTVDSAGSASASRLT